MAKLDKSAREALPDEHFATLDVSGIYTITNRENGKVYVGSAVNVRKRLYNHRYHLQRGTHKSSLLQRAWSKYGESAFDFCLVEMVDDLIFLLAREQFWIWRNRSADREFGYNICPTAMSALGVVRSEETRRKLSEANKGKPARPTTEETRKKISAAHKNRSPESYANLIAAGQKANAARVNGGWMSDYHRKRLSETQLGVPKGPKSEDHRRKLSEANRGKKPSDETREKMRISRLAYIARREAASVGAN